MISISCVEKSNTKKKRHEKEDRESNINKLEVVRNNFSGFDQSSVYDQVPKNNVINTPPVNQQTTVTSKLISLHRYYNEKLNDYWITIGKINKNYKLDATVKIYHPNQKKPQNTWPIFSCLNGTIDHFISGSPDCDGSHNRVSTGYGSQDNLLGYILKNRVSESNIALYRCNVAGNHYLTNSSICKTGILNVNEKPEFLGGFAVSVVKDTLADITSDNSSNCVSHISTDIINSVLNNPRSIPVPTSNLYGPKGNTSLADGYYTSTLPDRTIGQYINTVQTKQEWIRICKKERNLTLYWDNHKLYGLSNSKLKIFDDLSVHYFEPIGKGKLIISEPLRSTTRTWYPGCAGTKNLESHPRACGENNDFTVVGSQVFSQRLQRLTNIDQLSSFAPKKNAPEYMLWEAVHVSLSSVLDANRDQYNSQEVIFEATISKVPGDFSLTACKVSKSVPYYSSSVHPTIIEKGYTQTSLSTSCQVDAKEMRHLYINVRLVHLDRVNKLVKKSLCLAGDACKFEVRLGKSFPYMKTSGSVFTPDLGQQQSRFPSRSGE